MGFGIEAVDLAANWRPKAGLTIFESLNNIICEFGSLKSVEFYLELS